MSENYTEDKMCPACNTFPGVRYNRITYLEKQLSKAQAGLKIAIETLEDLRTGIYHTSRVTSLCEKALSQIKEGEE